MLKYLFLSLFSGILLSLSWPTYGVAFFIFVALVPLLLLEQEISKFSKIKYKKTTIFFLSYLTFLIWNAVSTGWLYGSKNPDGTHSLMAVLFPVLVNSLLYSIVFFLYSIYKNKQGTYWGLFFLVAIWLSFENFHLEWELSWPWLHLGNVFSEYPKIIQWYDVFGVSGGTLWILLVNILIFYTLRIWQSSRKKISLYKNISYVSLLIFLPILISFYKYYTFDLKPISKVKTLILQPNLDPYNEKYQKDSLQITRELLDLVEIPKGLKIDYVIAPETALPGSGSFSEGGLSQSFILNEVRKKMDKVVFLGGISSHRFYFSDENLPHSVYLISEETWVEHYNSAIQISNKVPNFSIYHKGKLVPGVEIFPYMNYLKPILGQMMLDFGGTMASLGVDKERKVFKNPHHPAAAAPIICYESIYGQYVGDYVKNGANFLAVMTNDSWWGKTQGHQQLLSYARLRAIEHRREVARSANGGISAHINALGEIESKTLYGDKTHLFAEIKLYENQTFYTKIGDLFYRLGIFSLGFLIFYPLLKKIRDRIFYKR